MLVATLFAHALHLNTDYTLSATALLGLLSVFCSMMIYHDTPRVLWNWRRSAPLFFGTSLILGAAAMLMFIGNSTLCAPILGGALALKFFTELLVVRPQLEPSLNKTALLITGRFQNFTMIRLGCLVLGGIGLPLLAQLLPANAASLFVFAFALLLAGEILERMLFFRTVDAPKMPGGLPA